MFHLIMSKAGFALYNSDNYGLELNDQYIFFLNNLGVNDVYILTIWLERRMIHLSKNALPCVFSCVVCLFFYFVILGW